MTVLELGALGEFLGSIGVIATLIYLSVQVHHATEESKRGVREARAAGLRELSLGVATSDSLSAAIVKAQEAVLETPRPLVSELTARGLERQDAHRVYEWLVTRLVLDVTDFDATPLKERHELDGRLRSFYSRGLGRLLWENRPARGAGWTTFFDHVESLIAEADGQQESQP